MKTLERTETQTNGDRVEYVNPPVNIRETNEGYLLQAEMPGVTKAGLEITVENGELRILGRREDPELTGAYLHRESRRWNYRRAFDLDPAIDTSRIQARMEDGLLTLTLPKAEEVKPRRITVE